MDHNVGVSVARDYVVKKMDLDFFEASRPFNTGSCIERSLLSRCTVLGQSVPELRRAQIEALGAKLKGCTIGTRQLKLKRPYGCEIRSRAFRRAGHITCAQRPAATNHTGRSRLASRLIPIR